MALTKEEKKIRRVNMYPPANIKDNVKKYAEKHDMSISEVFISGAKLLMKGKVVGL